MDDNKRETGPVYFEDIKNAFFRGEVRLRSGVVLSAARGLTRPHLAQVGLLNKIWTEGWERWRMLKTLPGFRQYFQENLGAPFATRLWRFLPLRLSDVPLGGPRRTPTGSQRPHDAPSFQISNSV